MVACVRSASQGSRSKVTYREIGRTEELSIREYTMDEIECSFKAKRNWNCALSKDRMSYITLLTIVGLAVVLDDQC